ncbi:MAG: hypothetical protein ACI90V_013417, partial [Bacillariaceae sp.]
YSVYREKKSIAQKNSGRLILDTKSPLNTT